MYVCMYVCVYIKETSFLLETQNSDPFHKIITSTTRHYLGLDGKLPVASSAIVLDSDSAI